MIWTVVVTLSVASLLASMGKSLLRKGAAEKSVFVEFINFDVAVGLGLYMVAAAVWVVGLSKVNLLTAFPFTVLNFFFVYLGAAMVSACVWA